MLKMLHVKKSEEEYQSCAVHVIAVRTSFHWGMFVTYETGAWGESAFDFGDVDEIPDAKDKRPDWWLHTTLSILWDVDKRVDALFGDNEHATRELYAPLFSRDDFVEGKWTVLHEGM